MVEETLANSARHSKLAAGPDTGRRQRMPGPGPASATGFPPAIGDWRLRQIPAGVWLSTRTGQIPLAVLDLAPEPLRVTVVVDAKGPGEQTDQALGQLFGWLSSAGLMSIRLVLAAGAGRYGSAASRAYGFDVIAVDGPLMITPHRYALARSHSPDEPGTQPQWWRFLPAGETIPAGMLSPSPAWECGLAAGIPATAGDGVAVQRVPAGLALHLPSTNAARIADAHTVWPDPDRMTIVVEGSGQDKDLLLATVTALLLLLPEAAAHGVRLWWPRAGADPACPALHEVARRCGVELIAPAADVSLAENCCGLCHGPVGAAPWVRFTGNPPGQPMSPLSPVPGWQRALAQTDLSELSTEFIADRIPAGLCVYRGRLPAEATRSLRLVLSGAGAGGEDSYAQFLAHSCGAHIIAPAGTWTATPDGRLRAIAASETGAADSWCGFSPRYPPGAHRPDTPPNRLSYQARHSSPANTGDIGTAQALTTCG